MVTPWWLLRFYDGYDLSHHAQPYLYMVKWWSNEHWFYYRNILNCDDFIDIQSELSDGRIEYTAMYSFVLDWNISSLCTIVNTPMIWSQIHDMLFPCVFFFKPCALSTTKALKHGQHLMGVYTFRHGDEKNGIILKTLTIGSTSIKATAIRWVFGSWIHDSPN